jgi:hypothetical protein
MTSSICPASRWTGLLFSPDLDLPSQPRRRWGRAGLLWWPYEKAVAHRCGVVTDPSPAMEAALVNVWCPPVERGAAVLLRWEEAKGKLDANPDGNGSC